MEVNVEKRKTKKQKKVGSRQEDVVEGNTSYTSDNMKMKKKKKKCQSNEGNDATVIMDCKSTKKRANEDDGDDSDEARRSKKAKKRALKEKAGKKEEFEARKSSLLSPEEKVAAHAAKNARRIAKLETLSADEIEVRRIRAERILERELAKKLRMKAKKKTVGTKQETQTKTQPPQKKVKATVPPETSALKKSKAALVQQIIFADIEESRSRQFAATASLRLLAPYEVFLKYLPHDTSEDQVRNFFDGCGEMELPKLMRCHATNRVIRGLEKLGSRRIEVTVATTTGTLQAEGTHTPAMFAECVRHLGVSKFPNGVFVDGTFGRGGHTRKILEAMGPSGELHAFDMDPEAVVVGQELEREDPRFHIHHAPFSSMFDVLTSESEVGGRTERINGGFVTGVLIDIGISSPQLDGGRGFRPEFEGPLDMRFDVSDHVESALGLLHRLDRLELAQMITEFGGEHPLAAQRISDAIALAKLNGTLPTRTIPFAKLVADAKGREYQAMHPAKMTFQALRIAVNREYEELRLGLEASLKLLSDFGKTAILTWKHTECGIVVDHSRRFEVATNEAPLRKWYDALKNKKPIQKKLGVVVEEARRPTADEIKKNSRSRSAVLHLLRKETGIRMTDLEVVVGEQLRWEPYPEASP